MRSPNVQGGSPALVPDRLDQIARIAARLPRAWVSTRRRRRVLFLSLAAPGFFAVFSTSLHRNLFVALVGFLLFGAAVVFRLRTEPLFEAATGVAAPPGPDSSNSTPKEMRDA